MTTTKSTPKPQVNVVPSIDVNITWLLQHINDKFQSTFSIDRTKKTCRTPRRNEDIEAAITHFRRFYEWSSQVHNYFNNQLFPVQTSHGLNLSAITAASIFSPIVPLFEEPKKLLAIEGPKSVRLFLLFLIFICNFCSMNTILVVSSSLTAISLTSSFRKKEQRQKGHRSCL